MLNATLRRTLFVFSLALFALGLTFAQEARAQLSGSYSIPTDFASFDAAGDTLEAQGVSGAVTFEVAAGDYGIDSLWIGEIPGTSAANTVTFRSQSGDSTDVTLRADDRPLMLDGTDYVRFEHMTIESTEDSFSHAVYIQGNVTDVQFTGNRVLNRGSGSGFRRPSSSGTVAADLVITGNRVVAGGTGIDLGGDRDAPSTGTRVVGNVVDGTATNSGEMSGEGVFLLAHDGAHVTDNRVENASTGIYLRKSNGALRVERNRILGVGTLSFYLYECNASSGGEGLIANNVVIARERIGTAINLSRSSHQRVFYNTVNAPDGATPIFESEDGSDITVKNNIFAGYSDAFYSGGTALRVEGDPSSHTFDHNVLYTVSGELVNFSDTGYAYLADYQNATGQGAHSVFADPAFVADTTATPRSPFMDDEGTPLVAVTTDINGTPRDPSAPSVGAVEYSSAATPLAGSYAIGPGSPFAESFGEAVDTLRAAGISAPVTFEVATGTYTEQGHLLPISGASAANTVTFRSASGDSTDVRVLEADADAFELDGADHVRLEYMTFEGGDNTTSLVGRAVLLRNRADDVRLVGNRLVSHYDRADDNHAGLYADETRTDDLVVRGNLFLGGTYGIYLEGIGGAPEGRTQNARITGNRFDSDAPTQGNSLKGQNGLQFTDNRIENGGLSMATISGAVRVERNRISSPCDGINFRFFRAASGDEPKGLIANNVIVAGGDCTGNNSRATGMYLQGVDGQRVFHNTVYVTGSDGYALELDDFDGTDPVTTIQNNIFAVTGGHALVSGFSGELVTVTLDHNDWYTSGDEFAYVEGTSYATLADYQDATGQDAHSVSIDPDFTVEPGFPSGPDFPSDTARVYLGNIAATDASLGGTDLTSVVSTDIDGQARSSALPTMGAHEVATLVARESVSSDGVVDFEAGYALDIAFSGVSGSGEVSVKRFSEGRDSQAGISESNVSQYRWCVEAGGSLTFGAGTQVRFKVSEIPNNRVNDPLEVVVYKRDVCGTGTFMAVPTSYDSDTGEIVAEVTSFSEFVFASDTQPLPVELAGFEAAPAGEGTVALTWRTLSETGNDRFEIERRVGEGADWTKVGTRKTQAPSGTSAEALSYRFTDASLPFEASALTYRLVQRDLDGDETTVGEKTVEIGAPQAFTLHGNFPNPMRSRTTIRYELPEKRRVTVAVYDALGRKVRTLVDEEQRGRQEATFEARGLASGVYFYRITAGDYTQTRKLVLVR